jgi:hypothetical protein
MTPGHLCTFASRVDMPAEDDRVRVSTTHKNERKKRELVKTQVEAPVYQQLQIFKPPRESR